MKARKPLSIRLIGLVYLCYTALLAERWLRNASSLEVLGFTLNPPMVDNYYMAATLITLLAAIGLLCFSELSRKLAILLTLFFAADLVWPFPSPALVGLVERIQSDLPALCAQYPGAVTPSVIAGQLFFPALGQYFLVTRKPYFKKAKNPWRKGSKLDLRDSVFDR